MHTKIRCRVERISSDTTTDPVLAWLYVLDAWEGGLPSARYLGVMADAAEIAGAPEDYVHDLRTRPAATSARGPAPSSSASARVCTPTRRQRRHSAHLREGVTRRAQTRSSRRDKFARADIDILGNDGHDQPHPALGVRRTSPVPEKRVRPAVPVDAVVLGSDRVRARQVEPPGAPCRSRTSYCRTGAGKPPSIMTSRASLSIGDSRLRGGKTKQLTHGNDAAAPDCRRTARSSRPRSHVPLRSAASSVASALGRRRPRATSIAVHAAVVAGRPATRVSGAPSRRCTTRPSPRLQSPRPGVEHVQIRGWFGVEAMRSGGSAEACCDRRTGRQIKPAQSQCRVHLRRGRKCHTRLAAARHYSASASNPRRVQGLQRLGGSHDSALRVKQLAELRVHAA